MMIVIIYFVSFRRGLYFLYTWLAGYDMLMLGNNAWLSVKVAGTALIGGRPASSVPRSCHNSIQPADLVLCMSESEGFTFQYLDRFCCLGHVHIARDVHPF